MDGNLCSVFRLAGSQQVVIAQFASYPLAANVNLDPLSLPAYRAIAGHLLWND